MKRHEILRGTNRLGSGQRRARRSPPRHHGRVSRTAVSTDDGGDALRRATEPVLHWLADDLRAATARPRRDRAPNDADTNDRVRAALDRVEAELRRRQDRAAPT
jgi:hypothetical protein